MVFFLNLFKYFTVLLSKVDKALTVRYWQPIAYWYTDQNFVVKLIRSTVNSFSFITLTVNSPSFKLISPQQKVVSMMQVRRGQLWRNLPISLIHTSLPFANTHPKSFKPKITLSSTTNTKFIQIVMRKNKSEGDVSIST